MSATGRGKTKRDPNDYYPTPGWCVQRFIEKTGGRLQHGTWIEPCAGDGAIIRACKASGVHSKFVAVELQERFRKQLENTPSVKETYISDYLKWDLYKERYRSMAADKPKAQVCITNPPYVFALEMIQHAMTQANQVCMLLRLNFLASEKRVVWMQNNTPDIYVLPNRPSFRGKGSDACEYGWFVWDEHSSGQLYVLDSTPRKIRSEEKRKVQAMLAI